MQRRDVVPERLAMQQALRHSVDVARLAEVLKALRARTNPQVKPLAGHAGIGPQVEPLSNHACMAVSAAHESHRRALQDG